MQIQIQVQIQVQMQKTHGQCDHNAMACECIWATKCNSQCGQKGWQGFKCNNWLAHVIFWWATIFNGDFPFSSPHRTIFLGWSVSQSHSLMSGGEMYYSMPGRVFKGTVISFYHVCEGNYVCDRILGKQFGKG